MCNACVSSIQFNSRRIGYISKSAVYFIYLFVLMLKKKNTVNYFWIRDNKITNNKKKVTIPYIIMLK